MNISKGMRRLLMTVALAATCNAHAAWVDIYSNDFNSGMPAEISGAGSLKAVQGYAGVGHPGNQFSGQYLVNSTGCLFCISPQQPTATAFTLAGLPQHTAIRVSFLLAIRDSWDGDVGMAPDIFNVSVNSVGYFSETFSDNRPGWTYSYVAPPEGLLTPGTANYDENPVWPDIAFDMGLDPRFQSIAHSSDTLTLSFFAGGAGWQGGTDESWGIDNLRISIFTAATAVPEPGSVALLSAALGLLGVMQRRRAMRD